MAKKYKFDEKRKEYRTQVWDGTYTATGKKHRVSICSKKSSGDLERKVREFNEKRDRGEQTNYTSMTFYEYAKNWLKVNKAAREYNTRYMYENCIETHLSHLDIPLADIRHSHFQEAINLQMEHPRTCEVIKVTFKQVIKAAERDRLLPQNSVRDICEDITLPKYKKPERRPLTQLETESFYKLELDDRKMAYVSILFYCGLRKAEALALTKEDFDFDAKTLSVSKVIIFVKEQTMDKEYPKSDNGNRTVPMPPELIERIEPFVSSSEGKLFKNTNGNQLTKSGYTKMWNSIIVALNKAAGWPGKGEKPIQGLTAHIFRHNYCTLLCYKVPLISTKKIAALLGDDERMVLEVYSHIIEEKEQIDEVISSIFKE